MSALVNPVGDFPLNDDWVYAYGVRSIVQGGRFELPGTGAPDVIAQAYWGALFCMPFGFSFTALRFSTLTLGWAGLISFYLLIQEVAGNRWLALLGGLALATNPIYFGLAHTFMTEVPFVSLVIIALWLFVRGLKRNASVPLLAGIVITLIAILVRQFALLLLLAFGVAYLVKNGVKWKTLAVAIIPLAFGAGVHHCLGAQLARVELQEAFRGLIGRLPGLRLAVPASDLEFKPGMAIHSLRELPVLWGEP